MIFSILWTMAWRDLGRNRRRTFFSILAVGLGLALLIMLNAYIKGVMEDALDNVIRMDTGHVQLRAPSYEADNMSLLWEDLLNNPEELAAQARTVDGVTSAAPVLWAGAYLNTFDESVGVRLLGVDPTAGLVAPFQDALVAGVMPEPDDRSGVLIGKRLADSLKLGVGDTINLAVVNASGAPDEAPFTVRGVFSTGIFSYDDGTVLMPLAKAQAFAGTGDRASAVILVLADRDNADAVAGALRSAEVNTLTWRDLNQVFLQTMDLAMGFYVYLYGIVILIVAVIVANTLLMAVFERFREIGIFAALGMRGRQITLLFLLQALALGLLGVLLGNLIGSAGVAWLANYGIPIGDMGAVAADIPISAVLQARFNPSGMLWLSLWTLLITLVASLYPAWYASRLEPVDALNAL